MEGPGTVRRILETSRQVLQQLAREEVYLPKLGASDEETRGFAARYLVAATRLGLSMEEARLGLRMALGLGVLELWVEPAVEEVVVRGGDVIVLYRNGRVQEFPDLVDSSWVVELAYRLADATQRAMGGSKRFVTTDLARPGTGIGRMRVSAVVQDGTGYVNLRLFPERPLKLSELGLPAGFVKALESLRYRRGGLLIAGDFAAGKSTLLNALLLAAVEDGLLPALVEGFAELDVPARVVRIEAPDPGLADEAMAEAVLRMRADVLAVGEITAPEEARRFLWACQVGRPVWATIHGASFDQALATLTELCSRAGMAYQAVDRAVRAGLAGVALLEYDFVGRRRRAAAVFDGGGKPLWRA